jgi:acetyl-CoA carboxylase biotin carboxylase subunit
MKAVKRVLIANRGEIAVRIIRACREAGISTVAVYSEADTDALHPALADDAVCIGPAPSQSSYLDIDRIIAVARATGADAIHPGYGFLAENAAFARAVEEAGLVFIGPTSEAIATMGDKTVARRLARAAGVPVVAANEQPPAAPDALAAAAAAIGYPLLIKAAAGGGGKGMRVVRAEAELAEAFAAARREAQGAFADDRVFLERYVERPRHVEIQVLADHAGTVLHLGERECSVQRRHQKIIEETPSPAVDAALRERMATAAIAVARAVGYRNAGTVEFLLAASGEFFFLEVNTRLQVEHPITELVTGLDLVQAQLRIAGGEPLWIGQADIRPRGHAIECRVCAEDPEQRFLPSPGTITYVREPHGPGIRVDSGIAAGWTVPVYYDPLLSKVSVWAETRNAARRRMMAALQDYVILGCTTTIPFLLDVLDHPAFCGGDTHTHFIDEHFPTWHGRDRYRTIAAIAAALDAARPHTAAPATAGREVGQGPWHTLGHWRLGSA